MTKLLFTAAAASLFALSAAGTADATELNDQIEICTTEIQSTLDLANISDANVKFRSIGGVAKRKKLSFRITTEDARGTARCTIVDEEIRDVRFPSQYRDQVELALAEQAQIVAEAATPEDASK